MSAFNEHLERAWREWRNDEYSVKTLERFARAAFIAGMRHAAEIVSDAGDYPYSSILEAADKEESSPTKEGTK